MTLDSCLDENIATLGFAEELAVEQGFSGS